MLWEGGKGSREIELVGEREEGESVMNGGAELWKEEEEVLGADG